MNTFYNPSGSPTTGSKGLSTIVRAEFQSISAAFDVMPRFHTTGSFDTTFNQQGSYNFTLPTYPGTLAVLSDVTIMAAAAAASEATRALAAESAINTAIAANSAALGAFTVAYIASRLPAVLPRTLPGTAGVLWNNGGVVSIS